MKIRLDFVTNSSSTNFLCASCCEIISGYDGDMEEEMISCKTGYHNFHVGCQPGNIFIKGMTREEYDKIKYCLDTDFDYKCENYPSFRNGITLHDLGTDVCLNIRSGALLIPSSMCPFCTFEDISFFDMSDFMFSIFGSDLDKIKSNIRKIYKNSQDLRDKITEEKNEN